MLPSIALPNILLHKECGKSAVVREFIQHDATPQALAGEVVRLLEDEEYQKQMMTGFAEIRNRLGIRDTDEALHQESASMRAVKEIATYF